MDPYRNFKFEVEIEGFVRAGFSKVSGLKRTVETIEYREGGENETPRKLSGQVSFDDVVLERGASTDSDFITWSNQIYDVDNVDGSQGDNEEYRKTVIIYAKDKAGTRKIKWTIYRAWPKEDGNGDLDASANDVLTETLTLANEGIKKEKLA